MLKYLLKIRQKRLRYVRVRGHRHGKHLRLRPPERAVVGHALKVKTTSVLNNFLCRMLTEKSLICIFT